MILKIKYINFIILSLKSNNPSSELENSSSELLLLLLELEELLLQLEELLLEEDEELLLEEHDEELLLSNSPSNSSVELKLLLVSSSLSEKMSLSAGVIGYSPYTRTFNA